MLNFGRKKKSYAERLRGTSIAPGMVAPPQTPYGARLNELSEMLNSNNGKTMRTSQAPDMSSMRVLGDPVDSVQGPGRLLPDPKRAPRTAGRVGSSSGVSVLGDPVDSVQGPGRLLPDPKRAPRTAGRVGSSSGVSGVRTTSGQGIIEGVGASKRVRQARAVGGLEGRGVRPEPGSRTRPGSSYPRGGRPGATVFGDMGMGIPSNAARGGADIPMLARMPKPISIGPIPDARPTYGPPRPVTSGPTPPTGGTGGSRDVIQSGGKQSRLRDAMKNKNFKRGALVAAGVLAAGSVVQSRRREGTSSGRQSMYRY